MNTYTLDTTRNVLKIELFRLMRKRDMRGLTSRKRYIGCTHTMNMTLTIYVKMHALSTSGEYTVQTATLK